MRNVLIAIIALGTISAFAGENKKCESKAYEEIMSSKTVKSKLQVLLADAQENLEKIAAISTKAQELAAEACN
jgi:hypothetical protein